MPSASALDEIPSRADARYGPGSGTKESTIDQQITIEPGVSAKRYWRDLWQRRGLVTQLAWRDFLVRYKQTYLGMAWAVVQPVVSMVVFTFVFGGLANMPPVGDAPYPIMVFAGSCPGHSSRRA